MFAQIPHSLIDSEKFTGAEKLFYMELARFADFQTGECNPAGDKLTKRNRTVIKKMVDKFVQHGFITIERRPGKTTKYKLIRADLLLNSNTYSNDQVLPNSNTTCYDLVTPPVTKQSHEQETLTRDNNKNNIPSSFSSKNKKGEKGEKQKPENFELTEELLSWSKKNGYEQMEKRLEFFQNYCRANNKKYSDWVPAFQNSVIQDWAKLNGQQNSNPSQNQKEFIKPTKKEAFFYALAHKLDLQRVCLDTFFDYYDKKGWTPLWKQKLEEWFNRNLENKESNSIRYIQQYISDGKMYFKEFAGAGSGHKPISSIYGIKLPINLKDLPQA